MTKKRAMDKETKIIISIGAVLVLLALYNAAQLFSFGSVFEEKKEAQAVASQLPKLSIITLTANDCKSCAPIGPVLSTLVSSGVNVTESSTLDYVDDKSTDIILKYGIQKLPALVVTGELDKSSSLLRKLNELGSRTTSDSNDFYIITTGQPPYIDTKTGDVSGLITLTLLTKKDCAECSSVQPLVEQIKQSSVRIKEEKELDVSSTEGIALAKKYLIEEVPTLVMSSDFGEYTELAASWNQVGTVEQDGSFVLRRLTAPYYSMKESRVVGLIAATVLRNSKCTECYNAFDFHRPILKNMGIIPSEESEVDYNTDAGKKLAEKYNITKLPALILEGDTAAYPPLIQIWSQVGSVEKDGAHVFRIVEIARKPYWDLAKGEIVIPTAQQS